MEKLEENVWSVVRQESEREHLGEGVQKSGKTTTNVRGRDMDVEEGTVNKLEVAEMRLLRWMFEVGEITKKVQERRLK